jgi:hypothetical protein
MQKIVINKKYGGFGLSDAARAEYITRTGIKSEDFCMYEVLRDDPVLVAIVEEMGEASWSDYARLKVVSIPEGVKWQIEEYDGAEHIAEVHRTWY